MGSISKSMLSLCDVQTFDIGDSDCLSPDLRLEIQVAVRARRSCALLLPPIGEVRRNAHVGSKISKIRVKGEQQVERAAPSPVMSAARAIEICCEELNDTAIFVAATGYNCRELFMIADGPNKFYMVGSMGHASSLGMGIAAHAKRPVVVLDGDGALLMHLGSLPMLSTLEDVSLVHVLVENGLHDSPEASPLPVPERSILGPLRRRVDISMHGPAVPRRIFGSPCALPRQAAALRLWEYG